MAPAKRQTVNLKHSALTPRLFVHALAVEVAVGHGAAPALVRAPVTAYGADDACGVCRGDGSCCEIGRHVWGQRCDALYPYKRKRVSTRLQVATVTFAARSAEEHLSARRGGR